MKLTALRQPLFLLLFFACLATALLASLASNALIPAETDFLNHAALIVQAKLALAAGQFPLRVAPLEHNGWFYPLFQFYAPTSYMIAGYLCRWFTPTNPFLAYKITIGCALFIGEIYMYRLAYWFVKSRPAAILASVVYVTSPYYLIVLNHIGAFNEAIALGLLPVVLYYTWQRYYYPTQNKTLLQVSAAWYLLATIHLVTFFYTSLFVGILLLLVTLKNRHHWMNLLNVGIAYFFGCLLAMWHLAPAVRLGKYFFIMRTFNSETLVTDGHRPFLENLLAFVSSSNGVRSAVLDVSSQVHPNIGLPILMAVGMICYAILNKRLSGNRRATYWLPVLLCLFFLAFFMVWSPINFWQWLPKSFLSVQYSWQLLGQLTWIGALLFAWAFCWLFDNKLDGRHSVVGVLLVVMATSGWLTLSDKEFIETAKVLKNPMLANSAEDYVIDGIKNPRLIQRIASIRLDDVIAEDKRNRILHWDTPHNIPHVMWEIASAPFVVLHGHTPANSVVSSGQLLAVVNNHIVSHYDLKKGAITWSIPLTFLKQATQPVQDASLQFSWLGEKKDQKKPVVYLDDIVLAGFLPADETLTVDQVKSHCHSERQGTVCTLTVPAITKLLMLPVLYYPDMLSITVNGKPVPYQSVLDGNRLVAAILPAAGKNVITIQFRGLSWANDVSTLSWGLWLLLGMIIVMTRLFARKAL